MDAELKNILLNLFAGEDTLFGSPDKSTVDRVDMNRLHEWYGRKVRKQYDVDRAS